MRERLNIGITCYPSLGGSGVVATELGKLLAEQGHNVHFITHSMPFRLGGFHKNIFYHEVEITDYHVFKYPPYDLSLAAKMAQVAKHQKLDVLHVHYAIPHAVCAYIAKGMVDSDLKVITTLHGTDITILAQNESMSDLIRLGINSSDAVTAVSLDLIRETRERLNITRHIDLTYNFIDKRIYYPRDCSKYRCDFASRGEKIIMHVSNFRPVKRVLDVVEVFRTVNEQVPSKLVFVGEGPEMARTISRVEELGLRDRVLFLGRQDEVAELLSVADIMLLPSEKESFGLVALEAMACGVPTIGSDAGGIPEVVTHGETGYLSGVGDTADMAENAIRLLKDEALYARMSAACVRRAQTEFCNDLIRGQYEDIYYRVLNECKERVLTNE
ncbi:N-acetyl-alpha-D-glucosaminyl L-malate synthase BshA [Paenibacillus thermotolerans]|uniref:N-acetyl-alpha-D-glucosaminyl L-malate synthase BshA n=1 Tax=Paenibacillus thermotolerans TaxID=3027807 RepID=UPI002367FF50|nr:MULTISPECIES: N-acetyl-alpha-D-glucosaminyl L-malate synthase BshA [unclassified Paenibacillus]